MLIAARNSFLMGGGKPTARDYVQDGLVAMWDGIENAGWGQHDVSATVWKDLIGDYDLSVGGNGFDSLPGWRAAKTKAGCTRSTVPSARPVQIEIGFKADEAQYPPSENGRCSLLYMNYAKPFPHITVQVEGKRITYSSFGTIYTDIEDTFKGLKTFLSLKCDWTNPMTGPGSWKAYIDGKESPALYYNGSYGIANSPAFTLNGRLYNTSWERNITGRVYYVRLYSRSLSEEELSRNHAIDEKRFNLP